MFDGFGFRWFRFLLVVVTCFWLLVGVVRFLSILAPGFGMRGGVGLIAFVGDLGAFGGLWMGFLDISASCGVGII